MDDEGAGLIRQPRTPGAIAIDTSVHQQVHDRTQAAGQVAVEHGGSRGALASTTVGS